MHAFTLNLLITGCAVITGATYAPIAKGENISINEIDHHCNVVMVKVQTGGIKNNTLYNKHMFLV